MNRDWHLRSLSVSMSVNASTPTNKSEETLNKRWWLQVSLTGLNFALKNIINVQTISTTNGVMQRRRSRKIGGWVSQVKPSNCCRRLEKLVLPSVFDTSLSSLMMWNLQSYPTTVLNEWMSVTFLGGQNILWSPTHFQGSRPPTLQVLRPWYNIRPYKTILTVIRDPPLSHNQITQKFAVNHLTPIFLCRFQELYNISAALCGRYDII